MDLLTGISSPDKVFSSTYSSLDQLDQYSQQSLSHGIDLYMDGNYKGAIKEFQRSIGLSPSSEYSGTAANYMANAYLQLGETEKAISTYKKAIGMNPTNDDLHVSLGNLYFGLDRFEEAEKEYADAFRIDSSAENLFSHANTLLRLEKYSEAEAAFFEVKRMSSDEPAGDYGLGLTYSKMERYDEALECFEAAVELDKEFYDAYAEMGYAYMDMGEKEKAVEIMEFLEQKDPSRAYTLAEYIYQEDLPNFSVVYFNEAFGGYPVQTPLSTMDAYLANANASKIYELTITFDKAMDRESIENLANWRISRATGSGPGDSYNYGMTIPSTEVTLSPLPVNVYYDADTWTATVKFKVTQNETADGTLDPGHVEFKFLGKDIFGKKIDPTGDQYCAFSGIA